MKRMEELRVKKRQEREEREAKETLEKEKRMRQEGRAMSGLKRDLEDQEIRRMAEQRRREKEETKASCSSGGGGFKCNISVGCSLLLIIW